MLQEIEANKWTNKNYFDTDEEIKASLACQIQSESHLYDFRELQAEEPYKMTVSPTQTIFFNICKQLGEEETGTEDWCVIGE